MYDELAALCRVSLNENACEDAGWAACEGPVESALAAVGSRLLGVFSASDDFH